MRFAVFDGCRYRSREHGTIFRKPSKPRPLGSGGAASEREYGERLGVKSDGPLRSRRPSSGECVATCSRRETDCNTAFGWDKEYGEPEAWFGLSGCFGKLPTNGFRTLRQCGRNSPLPAAAFSTIESSRRRAPSGSGYFRQCYLGFPRLRRLRRCGTSAACRGSWRSARAAPSGLRLNRRRARPRRPPPFHLRPMLRRRPPRRRRRTGTCPAPPRARDATCFPRPIRRAPR